MRLERIEYSREGMANFASISIKIALDCPVYVVPALVWA